MSAKCKTSGQCPAWTKVCLKGGQEKQAQVPNERLVLGHSCVKGSPQTRTREQRPLLPFCTSPALPTPGYSVSYGHAFLQSCPRSSGALHRSWGSGILHHDRFLHPKPSWPCSPCANVAMTLSPLECRTWPGPHSTFSLLYLTLQVAHQEGTGTGVIWQEWRDNGGGAGTLASWVVVALHLSSHLWWP